MSALLLHHHSQWLAEAWVAARTRNDNNATFQSAFMHAINNDDLNPDQVAAIQEGMCSGFQPVVSTMI